MIVRKYQKGDLDGFCFQPEQLWEKDAICVGGNAMSMVSDDGIVAVVWYEKVWEGRFCLYSVISAKAGKRMLALVRALRRLIADKSAEEHAERLEMTVVRGFDAGIRLAKMLGFEYEGTMRKVVKGLDFHLFARIY